MGVKFESQGQDCSLEWVDDLLESAALTEGASLPNGLGAAE